MKRITELLDQEPAYPNQPISYEDALNTIRLRKVIVHRVCPDCGSDLGEPVEPEVAAEQVCPQCGRILWVDETTANANQITEWEIAINGKLLEKHKTDLLENYRGEWVAIAHGKIQGIFKTIGDGVECAQKEDAHHRLYLQVTERLFRPRKRRIICHPR